MYDMGTLGEKKRTSECRIHFDTFLQSLLDFFDLLTPKFMVIFIPWVVHTTDRVTR
jgi:hypothetical protein